MKKYINILILILSTIQLNAQNKNIIYSDNLVELSRYLSCVDSSIIINIENKSYGTLYFNAEQCYYHLVDSVCRADLSLSGIKGYIGYPNLNNSIYFMKVQPNTKSHIIIYKSNHRYNEFKSLTHLNCLLSIEYLVIYNTVIHKSHKKYKKRERYMKYQNYNKANKIDSLIIKLKNKESKKEDNKLYNLGIYDGMPNYELMQIISKNNINLNEINITFKMY